MPNIYARLVIDRIKRTLGEGTFGKVVEVKDLKE